MADVADGGGMISPVCMVCEQELTESGGILLGPPEADGRVQKTHLCAAHAPTAADLVQFAAFTAARHTLTAARARASNSPDPAARTAQSRAWVDYRGALSALGAR
jgi:uncharacterized protein (UPF0261 family)